MIISRMPFYWRTTDAPQPSPVGIPETMDFEFEAMLDLGLVRQVMSSERKAVLEHAYVIGADVGQLTQDGDTRRLDEFWRFLRDAHQSDVERVLEIGHGDGAVLKRLRTLAKHVTAIDPSPQAHAAAEDYADTNIHGWFPHGDLAGPFDLIVHSDVLEHVMNPVRFLKEQVPLLSPTGRMIFTVPDCTESIRRGDVSMALHQHVSYFDYDSLTATLASAGLVPENIVKAMAWGAYYVSARPGGSSVTHSQLFEGFANKAGRARKRAEEFFKKSAAYKIGLYAPLRAVPHFPSLSWGRGGNAFYLDDGLRGKFIFNKEVFGFEDLFSQKEGEAPRLKLDHIFVASPTFGEQIARRLLDHKIACPVTQIGSLFQ